MLSAFYNFQDLLSFFKKKMRTLPDLHQQAFKYKNTKRLQRDGGRAWIKDSQLFESRKDANGRLITTENRSSAADQKDS